MTLDELREREAQIKLEKERAESETGNKKKHKRKKISTLSFDLEDEGQMTYSLKTII